MADVPKPTPVEGWARERRLGRFDIEALQEAAERQQAAVQAQIAMRRTRALTALILLSLGAVALLVGVTALLGWPWALLVFGMMCIIVSLMIGMERTPTETKEQ